MSKQSKQSKQRKCWIVKDDRKTRIYFLKPHWCNSGGYFAHDQEPSDYSERNEICVEVGAIPPQLHSMWDVALKNVNGDKAICEADGDTWKPVMVLPCIVCKGTGWVNGSTGMGTYTHNCWQEDHIKGTCNVRRIMREWDLENPIKTEKK